TGGEQHRPAHQGGRQSASSGQPRQHQRPDAGRSAAALGSGALERRARRPGAADLAVVANPAAGAALRSRATGRRWTARADAPEPLYHFDRARIVLTLDADLLHGGPESVRYARDLITLRNPETAAMSRIY